jgi:hypothetical protein
MIISSDLTLHGLGSLSATFRLLALSFTWLTNGVEVPTAATVDLTMLLVVRRVQNVGVLPVTLPRKLTRCCTQ